MRVEPPRHAHELLAGAPLQKGRRCYKQDDCPGALSALLPENYSLLTASHTHQIRNHHLRIKIRHSPDSFSGSPFKLHCRCCFNGMAIAHMDICEYVLFPS